MTTRPKIRSEEEGGAEEDEKVYFREENYNHETKQRSKTFNDNISKVFLSKTISILSNEFYGNHTRK